MSYVDVITKDRKPRIESLRDDMLARKDPDFFWPTGTQVYVGRQGSGKTISAVKHVLDLWERYPKAITITNVELKTKKPIHFETEEKLRKLISHEHFDPARYYVLFTTMEQLKIALVSVNNGFNGVIYFIDEIHTYFNALESKNIPMYIFTEISQQRKQRKLIIGTSQLFLRMAKPLREQCDNIIACSTRFGIFTKQEAYDGMTIEQDFDGTLTGTRKKVGYFFHSRKVRNSFDTYQKVVSGKDQFEAVEKKQ